MFLSEVYTYTYNNTVTGYYLTFRVIKGEVNRASFCVGCFLVTEHMDRFNYSLTLSCYLKEKYVAKQDAAYSSQIQIGSVFLTQFNALWSMSL